MSCPWQIPSNRQPVCRSRQARHHDTLAHCHTKGIRREVQNSLINFIVLIAMLSGEQAPLFTRGPHGAGEIQKSAPGRRSQAARAIVATSRQGNETLTVRRQQLWGRPPNPGPLRWLPVACSNVYACVCICAGRGDRPRHLCLWRAAVNVQSRVTNNHRRATLCVRSRPLHLSGPPSTRRQECGSLPSASRQPQDGWFLRCRGEPLASRHGGLEVQQYGGSFCGGAMRPSRGDMGADWPRGGCAVSCWDGDPVTKSPARYAPAPTVVSGAGLTHALRRTGGRDRCSRG